MSWTPVKVGGQGAVSSNYHEWLIDSQSDVSNPPVEAQKSAPGSVAYTADLSYLYMKASNGNWTEIGGDE